MLKINYLVVLLGIMAILGIGIGIYKANSAPLPEGFPPLTPPNQIEVKQYPPYRLATYKIEGELSQAANRAFYPLYQHISRNDISMTSPVETRYPVTTLTGSTSGQAEVSFLYANNQIMPKEIANNIEVKDIPAMTVVSLGLRGEYSYQSYQEGLKRLIVWLEEHQEYQRVGNPRRFFYDGPYVPDRLKRSEVQIPIEKKLN